MPALTPDPLLLRKYIACINGNVDPSVGDVAEMVSQYAESGIQPVMLCLREGFALPVHPHGFWKGGTITDNPETGKVTQTLVSAHVDAVSDGATVYTVTTGKTFFLVGYHFGAEGGGILKVKLVEATTIDSIVVGGAAAALTLDVKISSVVPIRQILTGQAITVTGGGASNNFATIWGWEE